MNSIKNKILKIDKRPAIVLIISASAAIVSILTSILCKLSLEGTVIIAFLSLGTPYLIDVYILTSRLSQERQKDIEQWQVRNEIETHLLNIRRDFFNIEKESYSPNDLFVSHFKKEIEILKKTINNVAVSKELQISADHFLNSANVLEAFEDDQEKIWRYTWPIETHEIELFDILHWKQYFEETVEMLEKRHLNEIRGILILKDINSKNSSRITKLLDFAKTLEKMEYRITTYDNFQKLCDSDKIPIAHMEFGLYGSKLLYINYQYEPVISGLFTKQDDKIKKFMQLFDMMWKLNSVTEPNPSIATQKITLRELFEFDKNPI